MSCLQICAVYFTSIYWLARHIGADSAPADGAIDAASERQSGIQARHSCKLSLRVHEAVQHAPTALGLASYPDAVQVLEAATAIAVSAVICYVGSSYAAAVGSPGLTIPFVTAITGGHACDSFARLRVPPAGSVLVLLC